MPGETRADYTQHVAVGAFTGSYFDSKNFTNRKMTRVDDAIDFNWGKGSPSSLMSRDSFSIRWVGNFVFQEGVYEFSVASDEDIRLYVDGKRILDKSLARWPTTHAITRHLTAGMHRIELEYVEHTGSASIEVGWRQVTIGGRIFYLSALGDDSNSGLDPDHPWQTLSKVNRAALLPGDSVLLRRGDRFLGTLTPQGSGIAAAPIRLSAYGAGEAPIIDAGNSEAAVKLFNQEYWSLSSFETVGATRFGIYIGGDLADRTLRHFRVSNVVVRDVIAMSDLRWDSGLIVVAPSGKRLTFSDVVIDQVTAYNTNQWWGIHVGANLKNEYVVGEPRGRAITVKNSIVHHVGGDGITVASSENVLIDNNVSFESGRATKGTVRDAYTPNGIWSWASQDVTIQRNEVYRAHSFGLDGGAFDVDWHSIDTTIQYNYAHDNDGYCIAFFGLKGLPTARATFRYNICSNNDRKAGGNDADVVLFTDHSGGTLSGIRIYNNTFYWNGIDNGSTLWADARTTGQNSIFKNNIIYSTRRPFFDISDAVTADHNLYEYVGSDPPVSWVSYPRINIAPSPGGREFHGRFADPMTDRPTYHSIGKPVTQFKLLPGSPAKNAGVRVARMGARDFFGVKVRATGPVSIGAAQ